MYRVHRLAVAFVQATDSSRAGVELSSSIFVLNMAALAVSTIHACSMIDEHVYPWPVEGGMMHHLKSPLQSTHLVAWHAKTIIYSAHDGAANTKYT